jgi:HlyD family secretion protein
MSSTGLADVEAHWGRKIVGITVAIVIAAVGAFFAYRAFFSGGDSKQEPYQPQTVGKMTLRSMITTSGVAISQDEAVLSFSLPGQITDIKVELGDEVKFGQPLMSVKADELENALALAQSNLVVARLHLQKLQEGATSAELTAAEDAVTGAGAALTKAENDLHDALDPPEEADLTAAEQAVTTAEAALSSAESKLNILQNGASGADVAAAEANLIQAETSYSQAERNLEDAQENEDNAASGFELAAETYCDIDGRLEDICADMLANNYQDPLTTDQVDALSESVAPEPTPTRTPGPSPTRTPTPTPRPPTATPTPCGDPCPTLTPAPTRTPRNTPEPITDIENATGNLIYASTTYRNSITAVENAEDNVTMTQALYVAANLALQELQDGASPEEITAAEDAVESARAQLTASQAALQRVIDGASDTTVANLYAATDKARATLASAVSARDELRAGATNTDTALQEQEVTQAELAVEKARDALDEATLRSPFDGVVSSLPVKVGQFVSSATPAATILTPGALLFELNIGETELPSIKVGQVGGLIFDAIQGKVYPIRVVAIGLSPEIQQGVIIYKVRTQIISGLDDPAGPRPAPGMNGSASIIADQKADVVAIPSALIRRRGNEKVVEVVVDGQIELRPVETGLSDGENIEITSGLNVGDVIAVRGVGQVGASPTKQADELPEGIR